MKNLLLFMAGMVAGLWIMAIRCYKLWQKPTEPKFTKEEIKEIMGCPREYTEEEIKEMLEWEKGVYYIDASGYTKSYLRERTKDELDLITSHTILTQHEIKRVEHEFPNLADTQPVRVHGSNVNSGIGAKVLKENSYEPRNINYGYNAGYLVDPSHADTQPVRIKESDATFWVEDEEVSKVDEYIRRGEVETFDTMEEFLETLRNDFKAVGTGKINHRPYAWELKKWAEESE